MVHLSADQDEAPAPAPAFIEYDGARGHRIRKSPLERLMSHLQECCWPVGRRGQRRTWNGPPGDFGVDALELDGGPAGWSKAGHLGVSGPYTPQPAAVSDAAEPSVAMEICDLARELPYTRADSSDKGKPVVRLGRKATGEGVGPDSRVTEEEGGASGVPSGMSHMRRA
jgi:hypothetical protein